MKQILKKSCRIDHVAMLAIVTGLLGMVASFTESDYLLAQTIPGDNPEPEVNDPNKCKMQVEGNGPCINTLDCSPAASTEGCGEDDPSGSRKYENDVVNTWWMCVWIDDPDKQCHAPDPDKPNNCGKLHRYEDGACGTLCHTQNMTSDTYPTDNSDNCPNGYDPPVSPFPPAPPKPPAEEPVG